ncbi:hypothetical protein ABE438_14615 [Bosea sp. TWI1241]|uniref:hypothetical protein n=1 Tax=Bosea sp. TWI1241 TaxID=3148904 RepID=UPI0032088EA9
MLPANATHQIAVLGALSVEAVNLNDLETRLPIARPALIAAAGRLIQRGLAERKENGVYALSATGSHLIRAGMKIGRDLNKVRKAPVYADSLRQRAWRAMRIAVRFTASDIARSAVRGEKDGEDAIRRFCTALTAAGYLVERHGRAAGTAPSSNGFKVWQLARDTGEWAPRYVQAKRHFVDRNTHEVFRCR